MNLLLELQLSQSGLNDLFETKGSFQKIGLGDLLLELAQGTLGDVASFNGRSGIVVSQAGDYNTDIVAEASNLYFTQARVLSTPITGFVSAPGVITPADTLISALGKLDGNNTAQDPGGVQYSIQTNNGANAFTGDANFTYDGIQTVLNTAGSMTGYGFAQSFISSSSSEAGINLDNLGAGGGSWSLVSTNNISGIGGGKFSILDTLNVQARLTIDQSGNVGIGTYNPESILTVQQAGNVNPVDNTTYGISIDVSGQNQVTFGADNTYAYIQSWQNKPLFINSIGNNILLGVNSRVGINQTNPQAQLHVTGGSVQIGDPGNDQSLYFGGTNAGVYWSSSGASIAYNAGSLVFSAVGASNAMILQTSTGNLVVSANVDINGLQYSWPSSQGKGALVNDGSGNLFWSSDSSSINTLTTSDNTPVPIFTMSLDNTSVYYLEGRVTARYADGSSVEIFHKNVGVRAEVSSSPSIITPGTTTVYESDGMVLNIDWVISGSSVQLQVTGDASASVNWKSFVNVYSQND